MARWTGTWLDGPGVTLGELAGTGQLAGERLGLPQSGPGTLAPFGVRAAAFVVDVLASALVAGLVNVFVSHPSPAVRQLAAYAVLFAEHVLLVALTGQTLGMRLLGVKVLRLSDPSRVPGFVPALTRTVPLLVTLGLAALFGRDGRGLHDRLAGSVVVRG